MNRYIEWWRWFVWFIWFVELAYLTYNLMSLSFLYVLIYLCVASLCVYICRTHNLNGNLFEIET